MIFTHHYGKTTKSSLILTKLLIIYLSKANIIPKVVYSKKLQLRNKPIKTSKII